MNYVVLRMRNPALALLLIVLSISCSRKIPSPAQGKIYTKISLNSIRADNLSEEITGNDEIHWMAWLLKDTIPVPLVLQKAQDSLSFYKKDLGLPRKILFEQSFKNTDNLYLIIALIEADTERPPEERLELVRIQLQWANYHPHDSLQSRLYETLLDDDLLGISFHKLNSVQNNPEGDLIFTGIHLFDKYFYRIRYKLD